MNFDKNEVTADILISTLKNAGVPKDKITAELIDTFKQELISARVMNIDHVLKGNPEHITKRFDEMSFVDETLYEHTVMIKKHFKDLMIRRGSRKIEITNGDNLPYKNKLRAFVDEVTQLILDKLKEAKAENITSYEVINGYELDSGKIFEFDTIKEEDFEKEWRVFQGNADRSSAMYEYYKMDSEGEKEFASGLEKNSNVVLFTKLKKGGFIIDTPYGDYSPDWAVVCRKDGLKELWKMNNCCQI